MGIDVKTFNHSDKSLWPHLGPLACDRKVHKEMGGPILSGEGSVWFVATDKSACVGIAAVHARGGKMLLESYVIPSRRGKGIHRKLCQVRDAYLKTLGSVKVAVCCRKDRWSHYKQQGFQQISTRGQWICAEKQL